MNRAQQSALFGVLISSSAPFAVALRKEASLASALRRTFSAGEKVGRGLGHATKAGAAVAGLGAAHMAAGGAGAVKGMTNTLITEPIKRWAKSHSQSVAKLGRAGKIAGYTAAGLGVAGGAYALHKANDKTTYGSNPNPRYY